MVMEAPLPERPRLLPLPSVAERSVSEMADEVLFVDAIPKTSVGKFDKKVMRVQLKHQEPKA